MDKGNLNIKEDSGFGLIRNNTIKQILSNITDENIRKTYLQSLKKEDSVKFNEFLEYLELTKIE